MSLTDIEKKTTLSLAMEGLRKEGYSIEYEISEGKMITNDGEKKSYSPDEVTIKHHYRFEGESNPSDMSILYAVKTDDGNKGMVVNSYGAYGKESVDDFMQECDEDIDESRE